MMRKCVPFVSSSGFAADSRFARWHLFLVLCISCLIPLPVYSSQAVDVFAKIFDAKSQAVVTIAVKTPQGDKLGSGFFISRNGKLVTNYHLIANATNVLIKLKSGQVLFPTEIINLDPSKDIAVLKIDRRTPQYFAMADSNSVAIGQQVCTIGSPQGLEGTMSDGLISSIRLDSLGMKIFQISVPLSDGSSGGPLINLNAEVVGITTAKMNEGESLNFAVPINYVRILLKKPFDASRYRPNLWLEKHKRAASKTVMIPSDARVYVVQKGDSLYRIAQQNNTSVKLIMKLNHLKDSIIKPGQRLLLPKKSSSR